MQKIGYRLLERMTQANLTSNELNIILTIGKYQDNFGCIKGVYYKDVCSTLKISYQGFYDSIRNLERKGIITTQKGINDFNITLVDNQTFENGYLSLKYAFLSDSKFLELTAGAKLLAMHLFRKCEIRKKNVEEGASDSFQRKKDELLKDMSKLLGVTERTVRAYMGDLSPFISVYLENGYKYYIYFYKTALSTNKKITENAMSREKIAQAAMRRNRIIYKDETLKKKMTDKLTTLLSVYHNDIKEKPEFDFSDILCKSLQSLNKNIKNKYKWTRIVSATLVRSLLEEEFGYVAYAGA